MSELERIRELRKQFLRSAYYRGMYRNGWIAGLDEIAEEMQNYMDTSDPNFVNSLADIARYLGEQGLIKNQADGYRLLSVTAKGIDEVVREASVSPASTVQDPTPHEQSDELRAQRRRFLEALYTISGGNLTQDVSWIEVASWMGWDRDSQDDFEKALGIAQYLQHSGFITIEVGEGSLYRITVKGIDEVEANTSQPAPPHILATPDEFSDATAVGEVPVEIQESLQRFKQDHPDSARVAFIMMQFGQTKAHDEITKAIRAGLDTYSIAGVRADDKRYHDDLFYNVLTYMHGCELGVAVYDRIEAETYNPNVALEVGYLFAMRKPVCLLKDRTLTTLQADLVGRLYDEFDPQDSAETIPPAVQKWLSDKGLPKI